MWQRLDFFLKPHLINCTNHEQDYYEKLSLLLLKNSFGQPLFDCAINRLTLFL